MDRMPGVGKWIRGCLILGDEGNIRYQGICDKQTSRDHGTFLFVKGESLHTLCVSVTYAASRTVTFIE